MPTAEWKLGRDIAELEEQEGELLKAIATAKANRDKLDDDKDLTKKQREVLKRKKAQGKEYDAALLKKYNDQLRNLNARITAVRANLKQRRGWRKNTSKAIRQKRRRLRSMLRPKIIDLKLDFKSMAEQTTVDKVIGHYTAGPLDESTQDAIRLCRQYHKAHLAQGWSGEAYMLCFTRDGDIILLRPAKWVGAHTLGENTGSYGIMVHGTTGDKPTKAQKRAIRWWAKNGHKAIMGPARTQKRPRKYRWYGHNDFNATGCPGSFKPMYLKKGK